MCLALILILILVLILILILVLLLILILVLILDKKNTPRVAGYYLIKVLLFVFIRIDKIGYVINYRLHIAGD